jgi:lysophospholipase L1-like esterase
VSRVPILLRVLGSVWLIVAGALIAVLAGELWLRIDRFRSLEVEQRYRAANVFFANVPALNAGDHSLWDQRWVAYRPGARAELESGGERFVVEINSRGYRTHEFEVPKPRGLVRVVCIGASTTVAGRTNQETYPALLEERLRALHPGLPLEVLDLGVSGVTSEHWLNELPQVLGFQPDIVVQYQAINDLSWRHLPLYAKAHPWRRLAASSLLFDRFFPLTPAELVPYLEGTMDTFAAIARNCREKGVMYLGSTFAGPDPRGAKGDFARHLDLNTEFWGRRFPMHRYSTLAAILAAHNRLFVDFAQREHVAYAPVDESLGDPALYIDVCHFTPEGISRLADAFLPAVDGLVQGTAAYRSWAVARETRTSLARGH